MGSLDTILSKKYPAKTHARRVADHLKSQGHTGEGIIYLEAQKQRLIEDNDEPVPFRQRRPFFYLSGCELPDSYLTYNLSTSELTLFIPPIDPESVIWSGLPLSPSEALKKYDVDAVLPNVELNAHLAHLTKNNKSTTVFAIPEQISEHVTFLNFDKTELGVLKKAIEDTRVVKDDYEIALLRKANEVSALAHAAVVEAARSAKNERELEGVFISTCICHGCREQSYHSIVASGENAATLHYQKNNEPMAGRLNLLLDAGGEYRCYCADVTRTFPINGKFSTESRIIYDIVYEMQTACFDMLKTGVMWEEVHAKAHKVAIKGLKKCGLLVGDEKEIFDKRVSVAFFPHGLGHYLGMDTHDTGGNANYEDVDSMFKYLRVRGKLPAGSVITVEPGIYFCRFIIEPYLEDKELSKYIDKERLERFWEVGGVRIEDNVVITDDGYDNLTTAPKEEPAK